MLYSQEVKSTSTKIKEKKYIKVLKRIKILHYCKSKATDCQEKSHQPSQNLLSKVQKFLIFKIQITQHQ